MQRERVRRKQGCGWFRVAVAAALVAVFAPHVGPHGSCDVSRCGMSQSANDIEQQDVLDGQPLKSSALSPAADRLAFPLAHEMAFLWLADIFRPPIA